MYFCITYLRSWLRGAQPAPIHPLRLRLRLGLSRLTATRQGQHRPQVGRVRRADRRHVGREHEHGAGRQQEAVSDERRSHPDVVRHEPHLRDHGPLAGFGQSSLTYSTSVYTSRPVVQPVPQPAGQIVLNIHSMKRATVYRLV